METEAAIADGQGKFELDRIEVAAPQGDEVLVEIKAAGLCHTDLASLHWKRPLVMGHEGAGIIQATGPDVSGLKTGDRVILNWAVPCTRCFQCREGRAVLCEESKPAYVMERSPAHAHARGTLWRGRPIDRSFNLGTLTGLALVRSAAVTPITVDIPFAAACIIGCGVMTGFGTAVNVAKVKAGSSVVVIGCGGVGLNIIQGAKLCGAALIIAVDQHQSSLQRARQLGATHLLAAEQTDLELGKVVEQVRQLTHGRGADYAFEATSVPRLAFVPLLMVRNGGAAFQASGVNDPVSVPMPWFMWNKTYVTPLYGDGVPARDFPRILEHYARKELLLDELVTQTYGLHELGKAFEDMLAGRLAKGVVVFP